MKTPDLPEEKPSAPNKRDYNPGARWQVAHALARLIPLLPAPEKTAAGSLLLATLLDLLRGGHQWN